MNEVRYPDEQLDPNDDDGTMVESRDAVANAVIGHRIVKAERRETSGRYGRKPFVITLDNGKEVALVDTSDCCAFTELNDFWLHPESVNHVILGVGTTEQYMVWHIYADFGDVMRLNVAWSCGNPFYYGFGFDVTVEDIDKSNERGI